MTAVQRDEGRAELRGLNVTLISGGNETNTLRTTVFKRIVSTLGLRFYTWFSPRNSGCIVFTLFSEFITALTPMCNILTPLIPQNNVRVDCTEQMRQFDQDPI